MFESNVSSKTTCPFAGDSNTMGTVAVGVGVRVGDMVGVGVLDGVNVYVGVGNGVGVFVAVGEGKY